MRVFISLVFISILTAGPSGCIRKIEEGKVPMTTSSDEAKKEFLEGRSLAEKLLATNSIQHFDKAICLDSNFALAYLNRANNSLTAKDFFFYLNKAVSLKDKCSDGERLLILSVESAANANTVKQKEYLDRLSTLYPDDERVRFNLGGYYFVRQDFNNAIEQYKKAIEIAPDYSPAYNILGYSYRQIEKYSEAENAFKKYIELIPGDPNPYDSYAELLLRMGRFDESITNYRKALNIDPNFVASHIGIATNYIYKNSPDSGIVQLKKLQSIARNEGELRQALLTQMILYIDAGKTISALQELGKKIAMEEKVHDLAAMAGDYGLEGAVFLENGKYIDALKSYERSEQLIASSSLSRELKDNAQLLLHYNRSAVALAKKEINKAKTEAKIFQTAAEADKNINLIWLAFELEGRIAFAENNFSLAIESLMKANLQDPYNLYRLALSYQADGNKEKAKEFCKKAAQFYSLPFLNYAFIRVKAKKLLAML